jgi:hypothetical protein
MVLPKVIYLKDSVATWGIDNNAKYSIRMRINDPGDVNDPLDPGDQGQVPVGQGMFYSTDQSAAAGNSDKMWPGYMGWLAGQDETVANNLLGSKLYGFLFLPIDDNGSTLTIGRSDGEKIPFTNSFADAAVISYTVGAAKPWGFYNSLLNAGNDKAEAVNTGNTVRIQNSLSKFFQFTAKNAGVSVTPSSIQKGVQIHFVDIGGNNLGILDSTCVNKTYWVPVNAPGIFLVATIQAVQDKRDPSTWEFNIGDPRTGGSMTAKEV